STNNASVLAVDSATGKLDPKGAGTVTITISQAGDNHFSAASNATLNVAVSQDRSQTITFDALTDQNATMINQTISLGATASSGLTVTYESNDTSVASVSGSTLTINALGLVTITAKQAGGTDPSNSNITYLAAEDVAHSFSVSKASQFINFAALADRNNTAGQTFTLSATASSGLAVTFESNNTALLEVNGTTATILDEGPVTVTARQAGNSTYLPASKERSFSLIKDSQTISFGVLADTNTTVSTITLTATASSGLPVTYESNNTAVATVSGNTLTIKGAGDVTITARQAGNYAYRPALPEARSFNVKLVGRPLVVLFDGGGTMGTSESFKARVSLKDGNNGKLIDRSSYTTLSIAYSITNSVTGTTNATVSGTGGINTGTGSGSFTVTATVTDSNSDTKKRYVPGTASITVTVDGSKDGQEILVSDGGKGGFGLRDLPLSRKPIPIGKMFKATSNLALSYTLSAGAPFDIVGTGDKKALAFKKGATGVKKGDFNANGEIEITITASQAGNGSYHAAQPVSRTFKLKKPSKSIFFEERKQDARYDSIKTEALSRRMPAGVTGAKAIALFDSDSYDSDGDGVSNLLERAFGGDSLGNDSRDAKPAPIIKDDGYEYITFTRYDSDYQNDMGLEYIVEESSDLRTWSTVSSAQSTTDLGGGMERVVYRTSSTTPSGSTQYIRVRVKAR
ncbi:MAG: hypothetical protein EB168_09070, partial [Euryarchaeota archaeon]|nr:hypothetical protein [Euryarchaeota archaeon]